MTSNGGRSTWRERKTHGAVFNGYNPSLPPSRNNVPPFFIDRPYDLGDPVGGPNQQPVLGVSRVYDIPDKSDSTLKLERRVD